MRVALSEEHLHLFVVGRTLGFLGELGLVSKSLLWHGICPFTYIYRAQVDLGTAGRTFFLEMNRSPVEMLTVATPGP
jgi:hypothetical protein